MSVLSSDNNARLTPYHKIGEKWDTLYIGSNIYYSIPIDFYLLDGTYYYTDPYLANTTNNEGPKPVFLQLQGLLKQVLALDPYQQNLLVDIDN